MEGFRLQNRLIRLSFFNHQTATNDTATRSVELPLDQVAPHFRSLSEHRPPKDFSKASLNSAKDGRCFIGGYGATRGSIESRSCLVLDADDTAAVDALLAATHGYYRIMWDTYKSGLREDSDLWVADPSQARIRIILPLDRDITRGEWQHPGFRQAYLATFAGSDTQTVAINAMAYLPANWQSPPDVMLELGPLYPADNLVRGSVLLATTADYSDPATEIATTEHLSRLWETVRKRKASDSKDLGKLIYAVLQGNNLERSGSRHQASLDVCNLLATEKGLKECSVDSILDLCEPTLEQMRLDGSDESRDTWREMMMSWRIKVAASDARIDFAVPGASCEPGTTTNGTPAAAPNEVDVSLDPLIVLDNAFAIWPGTAGSYQFYSVTKELVCKRLDDSDSMLTTVVNFSELIGKDGERREWSAKSAREVVALWRAKGRQLPAEPTAVRFLSDPGYCYQRLSFDLAEGATPAWNEFCSRLSNADYFRAFVWTAFEPRNKGRQILWLTGNGQDGKSRVMSVIADALGKAAAAVDASDFSSTFGTSRLDGKRLVYIGDCKDAKLMMEAGVRKATSGDSIRVEFKGKTGYDKNLHLKLIVMSNIQPDITSTRADESRLLPLTISESANKNDQRWPERLAAELPAFLYACRETYSRICPDHGDFVLDDATLSLISRCSGIFEDEFAYIAKTMLRFTGNRSDKVSRPRFNENMKDGSKALRWKQSDCNKFWAYCATKHPVHTLFVDGEVFISGCHLASEKAANPLTIVAAADEGTACPF